MARNKLEHCIYDANEIIFVLFSTSGTSKNASFFLFSSTYKRVLTNLPISIIVPFFDYPLVENFRYPFTGLPQTTLFWDILVLQNTYS